MLSYKPLFTSNSSNFDIINPPLDLSDVSFVGFFVYTYFTLQYAHKRLAHFCMASLIIFLLSFLNTNG